MYGKLRERKIDSFFIKGFVDSLVNIKIYSPIVATVHPYTGYDIHTAGIQRMKGDKRSGIVQDT